MAAALSRTACWLRLSLAFSGSASDKKAEGGTSAYYHSDFRGSRVDFDNHGFTTKRPRTMFMPQ